MVFISGNAEIFCHPPFEFLQTPNLFSHPMVDYIRCNKVLCHLYIPRIKYFFNKPVSYCLVLRIGHALYRSYVTIKVLEGCFIFTFDMIYFTEEVCFMYLFLS